MDKEKVILFQDSFKFKVAENRRNDVEKISHELSTLIKNPVFDQGIIDPKECLNNLTDQISFKNFSCIVDLTGAVLRFSDSENLNRSVDFGLSRLKNIVSPKMDGVGYILKGTDNRETIKRRFDISRPLILDDVGWSGRSALETLKILDFDPTRTTFAFLVLNRGNFGPKAGAFGLLQNLGSSIFSGLDVTTPLDDGFHLIDFAIQNISAGQLEEAIEIILSVQKLREQMLFSSINTKAIETSISVILNEKRSLIFPNSKSSETIIQMQKDGNILSGSGIPKNSFCDINPPNWLMPSFSRRAKYEILINNKKDLLSVLLEMNNLLK